MSLGLKGKHVGVAIKCLVTLTGNPRDLHLIREATDSCIEWGCVLQELMEKDSIKQLFVGGDDVPMQLHHVETMEKDLRAGEAFLVSLKLFSDGQDCDYLVFCIEPRAEGREARILHGGQDGRSAQAERNMPVAELKDFLKSLLTPDSEDLRKEFKELLRADLGSQVTRVSVETVIGGRLRQSLDEIGSRRRLSGLLGEMTLWQSGCSPPQPDSGRAVLPPTLDFVFAAGGALVGGEPAEVALSAAGQVAQALGAWGVLYRLRVAAWQAIVRCPPSRRAIVASGVAFFRAAAVWDVAEWEMRKVTEVEPRQRWEEGLGGAGGLAEVHYGFGSIGMAVGGVIGGVHRLMGRMARKATEEAIWDSSEGSVMRAYKFFGWHGVKRNARPVKSAEEMETAYDRKLESRPRKMEVEDWDFICTGSAMVLLRAMYPVFREVMGMADDLQNGGTGVSSIGTMMYRSVSEW